MNLVPIKTERLVIRRYESGDLAARHDLITQAFGEDVTLADTRQWLDWAVANYRELDRLRQPPYGDYAVALRGADAAIGSVGLVPSLIPWAALSGEVMPGVHPLLQPEFGLYWGFLPAHQGNGYATEAARAFIDALFATLHAPRLVATTEFANAASQRVMAKLGMTIRRNPGQEPPWFEVVGVLDHPSQRA